MLGFLSGYTGLCLEVLYCADVYVGGVAGSHGQIRRIFGSSISRVCR